MRSNFIVAIIRNNKKYLQLFNKEKNLYHIFFLSPGKSERLLKRKEQKN